MRVVLHAEAMSTLHPLQTTPPPLRGASALRAQRPIVLLTMQSNSGKDFAIDDLAEGVEDWKRPRSCLNVSNHMLSWTIVNHQKMLRDHVLNESPTELIMLRASFEVSVLSQCLRTLIIGIYDGRLSLEKTKFIGELANVNHFRSTCTNGNELCLSCRKREDRCKSSFPRKSSIIDKEIIAIRRLTRGFNISPTTVSISENMTEMMR